MARRLEDERSLGRLSQEYQLELLRAEAYKPNSRPPGWEDGEGEVYTNLPGAVQLEEFPTAQPHRFWLPTLPASVIVRTPEAMVAAQNVISGRIVPTIDEMKKRPVNQNAFNRGFLDREKDEWQRVAPQVGSRLGWDHEKSGFMVKDDTAEATQIASAECSVEIMRYLREVHNVKLMWPEHIELDVTKSTGGPFWQPGLAAHLSALALSSGGTQSIADYVGATVKQTPAPTRALGLFSTTVPRWQPRLTSLVVNSMDEDGTKEEGEAEDVFPKQRVANNSPKVINYETIALNTGYQLTLSAALDAGEVWPYVFKATNDDVNDYLLADPDSLRCADGKKWDIKLRTKPLLVIQDGFNEWASESGWPTWFIDRLVVNSRFALTLPRSGTGCRTNSVTMYGHDEEMENGLQSGVGNTSMLGTWFNLGVQCREAIDYKGEGITPVIKRQIRAWAAMLFGFAGRKRILGKLFSDDSAMMRRNATMAGTGIDNEMALGADFLKRNVIKLADGSFAVVSLTGTTGGTVVTQERGGVDRVILDKTGLPKAGISAGGIANLVRLASSLAARERVIASPNPLRHLTFMPAIAGLIKDPELDIRLAEVLKALDDTAPFSKLSELLVKLTSGVKSAFEWLRVQSLAGVQVWNKEIKAKGLALDILVGTLSEARLYLEDLPELTEALKRLALEQQRKLRWPTRLLKEPTSGALKMLERVQPARWKFVPEPTYRWEPNLITEPSLEERGAQLERFSSTDDIWVDAVEVDEYHETSDLD